MDLAHRMIATNGIQLHAVEAGAGDLVLLLHGFPEFWYSWRHQLPALAAAGFRAVALDLRGYHASDRPPGISSYRVEELVSDVAGVIRKESSSPALVVGHDWGGVIAWRTAALHPELVRGLAVLNAPHPAAFRKQLLRNPAQWLRSSYTLFFQMPALPERLLGWRDFALLERGWRKQPARRDAFTDQDIAEYKRAFRNSGLTGPLNYYRAVARHPGDLFGAPQTIRPPTLVIWGERDPFLSSSMLADLPAWVGELVVERIPGASHWVQNDAPDRVNTLLINFFCRVASEAGAGS